MPIRDIMPAEYQACLDIYNYYILNTTITLETEALSLETFAKRIEGIRAQYPFLVYEDEAGELRAYAYLSQFHPRAGYRYTCDLSIYVRDGQLAQGIGTALFTEIFARAKALGLKDMISLITEENERSLRWHSKHGFKTVGLMEGVAEKFGRRFGVYYLQKRIDA